MQVKFKSKDGKHVCVVEGEAGDTWDEQVERFYEFLTAQGFIITYASFLRAFGDIVKNHSDCFKGD